MRDTGDILSEMSRLTVQEAATFLGISTGAVRNRLSRGTLSQVKENGTVYVLVDTNMSRHTDDTHGDIPGESTALISAKDETIRVLQEQLEAEREQLSAERKASAELRRIIAGLVHRVPELEAVSEPRESIVSASEGTSKGDDTPKDSAEAEIRQSWWRRFFGVSASE